MNKSTIHNADARHRLRLREVSFDRVEFELVDANEDSRPVIVRAGSARTCHSAVIFPSIGTDATQSTGIDELDEEIRERAAEELVRLEATTRAAEVGGSGREQ